MDVLHYVLFICLTAVLSEANDDDDGPCFQFSGNSYLHFTPNNFDNNNEIHIKLWFKTGQPNGIILYSRGQQGDDEALFISNGILRYHLFNTSPVGIEGYFGAYLYGRETVDDNEWIKVDLYRSWRHVEPPQRRVKRKTGIVVKIGGEIYTHLDYLERSDISLQPTIYLGGYKESLSTTVQNFTGQIKAVYEEKNRYLFENPSLNYMSRVSLNCFDGMLPN